MRRALGLLLLFASLALLGPPDSFGQSVTVQQSPSMLTACAQVATANGTAQQTITITPSAGMYFYLCGLDLQYCASGTAATATQNVYTTTTGFQGTPKWQLSVSNTASVCFPTGNNGAPQTFQFPLPLKSANAGTAVTFVSPAAITNVTFNMNVYGFFAP